jgi:hypothetical protein
MSFPVTRILVKFTRLLQERLENDHQMTEDTLRYTMFLAIVQAGKIHHTRIALEVKRENGRNKIDCVVMSANNRAEIAAFEFKYHRKVNNKARTSNAGKLFNDIFRLSDLSCHRRYVVYLSDDVMVKYFRKRREEYGRVLNGREVANQVFVRNKPKTFREEIKASKAPCYVKAILKKDISLRQTVVYLRVFQIKDAD